VPGLITTRRVLDVIELTAEAIVKLLGNLPNATLRTHYIHRCAELLSRGEARLTLRIEEDLRTQVRGQRWHGRSQKWQTKGDRTLLEEAERWMLERIGEVSGRMGAPIEIPPIDDGAIPVA